jgi:hypothetical protein
MPNLLSRQREKPPWKLNGRPLATHAMLPAKLGSEKADRSAVDRVDKWMPLTDLPRRITRDESQATVGLLDTRRRGRPIEPKNLYDRHCHAVSPHGDNASAADHLWMAGGDRRLKHSVLGELAGRSRGRCPRIFRLHAEAVIRWYQSEAVTCLFVERAKLRSTELRCLTARTRDGEGRPEPIPITYQRSDR